MNREGMMVTIDSDHLGSKSKHAGKSFLVLKNNGWGCIWTLMGRGWSSLTALLDRLLMLPTILRWRYKMDIQPGDVLVRTKYSGWNGPSGRIGFTVVVRSLQDCDREGNRRFKAEGRLGTFNTKFFEKKDIWPAKCIEMEV